uniref:G-protein coupled receptors family 1 profile domain-containing protein n=1 Tax=Octopus bimaculoides TaxID=37653 RepID=A0A0L8ICK4_OCTBM
MRQTKIVPYLHCLALVDFIAISIYLPKLIWLSTNFQYNRSYAGIFNSKLYVGFTFCIYMYSSWITVIISVERLLAIFSPFSRFNSSGSYKPYIVLLCLLVCVTVMYTMLTEFLNNKVYALCIVHFIYAFIPAMILFISSILMLHKLLHRPYLGQNFQRNSSEKKKSTVYVVIAINSLFLLTTFPTSIYYVVMSLLNNMNTVLYLFLDMLACINNVFNFMMYVVGSKSFRDNLKQMFCKVTAVNRNVVYSLQNSTT